MATLEGIIVPTVLYYDADGAIDFDACGRHFRMLEDGGVNGLFVLGSTGESFHLLPDERIAFAQWAVDEVDGRVPLLVGTGDLVTDNAIALTRHARDIGADAAVLICPWYWPPSERHLYRYYADVADAVEMPLLIYNYPAMTGVSLSPRLILRLAMEYPHIVGIKETISDPVELREVATTVLPHRSDFAIFTGSDDLQLLNLVLGGRGAITTSSNFAYAVALALRRAFADGDLRAAAEHQKRLCSIARLYALDPCLGMMTKEALYMLNMGPEPIPRHPGLRLEQAQLDSMRQILAEAGLLPQQPRE